MLSEEEALSVEFELSAALVEETGSLEEAEELSVLEEQPVNVSAESARASTAEVNVLIFIIIILL